jgi:hypothetical protein
MIEEYALRTGHADLPRRRIDRGTGAILDRLTRSQPQGRSKDSLHQAGELLVNLVSQRLKASVIPFDAHHSLPSGLEPLFKVTVAKRMRDGSTTRSPG